MFYFLQTLTRDCDRVAFSRDSGFLTFTFEVPSGSTWMQVVERHLANFPDFPFIYDASPDGRYVFIRFSLSSWYMHLLPHSSHLRRISGGLYISKKSKLYETHKKEKKECNIHSPRR